ncbi:MAG: oligosaccharide flippase family protein [Bacteroidota bacterium]|nr:oligosaccharide flippase family protein [Bacteroidota bacterium]
MSNPLKKLAGQTVIYGLGNVLPRFINYLFSFVLTYIFLEPAALAPNAVFFGYISFLNIIFTYGMETAFFNFVNKTEDKEKVYSTALISILASTVFLTLLLIVFSNPISTIIKEPDHANYVVWCVLIVATDAIMAIPFARLRLTNNAKRFAAINFIKVIATIALNVFFFIICKRAFEKGDDSFVAGLYSPEVGIGYAFLAQLLANLFCILLLAKEFKGLNFTFDKELWKKMFSYSWPLLILGLAGMVNETFDRIILKYLLPENIADNEIGIYSNCYKIAMLMTIFTQAFKYAAEPFFFNGIKDTNSQKLNALVMKYYILFCLFLFLGTMMNLPWIQLAISKNYRVGLSVVPILLWANLCLGVYWNLSIWFKLTGQTRYGAIITIIGAIITLSINLLFIPKFGYMACAWATLASYSIMMIISYLIGKKYYPIKYNIRSISVFTGIALAFYFISITYEGLSNTILKLVLNNILLFVFAYIFYKLEFENLKKLKHLE